MRTIELEMSGGCQCGAVRYHITAIRDDAHICHCRMCQKAAGSYFAPLAGVPHEAFEWTRGTPGTFLSSDPVERGFCRDCGTPLFYRTIGGDHISIMLGTLDEPARVPPRRQYGNEARMPFFDTLPHLAGRGTTTEEDSPDLVAAIGQSNHQHPDHDTGEWPMPQTPKA